MALSPSRCLLRIARNIKARISPEAENHQKMSRPMQMESSLMKNKKKIRRVDHQISRQARVKISLQ